MFKVSIVNKISGSVTHEGKFLSEEEIESWITACEKDRAWGNVDRWIESSLLSEEQILSAENARKIVLVEAVEAQEEVADEETGEIIQEKVEPVSEQSFVEYFFSKEYEIQIVDITAANQLEQKIAQGLLNQKRGSEAIAKIYALNEIKFSNGSLTQEAFLSFMSDPTVAMIERLLRGGALESAVALINTLSEEYFSAEEKAQVIADLI